jgi:hypothetical protein
MACACVDVRPADDAAFLRSLKLFYPVTRKEEGIDRARVPLWQPERWRIVSGVVRPLDC